MRTLRLTAIGMVSLMLLVARAYGAAPDVERGATTYKELCVGCHGSSGQGAGKEAAALATQPKDLSDCQRMSGFTDEQLFHIIKESGGAGGLSNDMPAYASSLEDSEIRDTIAYVRSLCHH